MPYDTPDMHRENRNSGYVNLPTDQNDLEDMFNGLLEHIPEISTDSRSSALTLYEILESDQPAESFRLLVREHPQLLACLQDETSEYTVFLPPDLGGIENQDPETVQDILSMHISPHYVTTEGFLYMPNIPTAFRPRQLNGPQIIRIRASPCGYSLNSRSRVIEQSTRARNGIIHRIDHPLVPPPDTLRVLEINGLSTFRQAIRVSGVESILASGDIKGKTILAPHNAAFEALGREMLEFLFNTDEGRPHLRDMLKLHILPNTTFFSNFIWPKNDTGARQTSETPIRKIKGKITQQVPSMLGGPDDATKQVSVTVARCNGLISMVVNDQAKVVKQDLAAMDGVVQVLDAVLVSPGGPGTNVGSLTLAGSKRQVTSSLGYSETTSN